MIRHIVLWKFRESAEGSDRSRNLRKAKALLDALPATIPLIRGWETGIDMSRTDQSFDLGLSSLFETPGDLARYQAHPDHVKVVEFLRKAQSSKVVIDYEA